MVRHEYLVAREAYRPSGRKLPDGWQIRPPTPADRDVLADLMMDAYRGTIDYDGETLQQAVEEVERYLAGEAVLAGSLVAGPVGSVDGAILMSLVRNTLLVGYVMTRAAAKDRGVGAALLDLAAAAAWDAGNEEIRAWITEGNTPSERIFTRVGFEIISSIDS